VAVALAATVLVACGGGSSAPSTPSGPNTPTNPTPTPTPAPTPNAFAAACGTPLPAMSDAYGYKVKVQLEPSPNKKILNASPQVRNEEYCTATNNPGQFCTTRLEGSDERVPCDHYLSGTSDTGRPGPNWFQVIDGKMLRCGGYGGVPEEAPNCSLKENDQYLLDVSAPGLYRACAGQGGSGTCGGCILTEDTFGVIHRSPAGLCKLDPGD